MLNSILIIRLRNSFQQILYATITTELLTSICVLGSLGHRISTSSGEARETCFLFQWISVSLQRFNAVLLHDCLPALDCADWVSYLFVSFFPIFLKPLGNTYRGYKIIIIIMTLTTSWGQACPVSWMWISATLSGFRRVYRSDMDDLE